MIRKLKIKVVLLSMLSLFALLVVIVAGINGISYRNTVTDADMVLDLLSENRGAFPNTEDTEAWEQDTDIWQRQRMMSPELRFESRFFTVVLDESGTVQRVDTARIAAVDETQAEEYAKTALEKRCDRGFLDDYRYVRYTEDDTTILTFLDWGRRMDALRDFLWASILMSLGGYLAVFFVVVILSGKMIRPIAESYEKQKRFITDAGHEIKTPLAIINANVDVLEMDMEEEDECLTEIRQQTKRLAALTNDLVYLTRMEEAGNQLQKIEFPISDVAEESVKAFKAPLKAQEKTLECEIEPLLSMRGDEKAIRQLISILMDNAVKYSPAGGSIHFALRRRGRDLVLSVENPTATPVEKDDLKHVFDRFYRTDRSRNSETGGHGIGLSVAQAIVTAHGGKIHATTTDGMTFCVTAVLPM